MRAFCDGCGKLSDIYFPVKLRKDDSNGENAWGDLQCKQCKLVINTLSMNGIEGDVVFISLKKDA